MGERVNTITHMYTPSRLIALCGKMAYSYTKQHKPCYHAGSTTTHLEFIMARVFVDEDGWIVEPVQDDTGVQHITDEADDTTTRHCKRCRKDQPVENFVRLVSEKQALFLARREGLATTTQEYYDRAAIHKSQAMAHKLCNACAAKLRTTKRETAEQYDKRLRLLNRYERQVRNPYYISPSKTPNEPLTITAREVKVREYRAEQSVRRVDGRRRAEKARYAKDYGRQMREVRNEMQRIEARLKTERAQGNENLTDFINAYVEHLKSLRDTIRAERYSHTPDEPLASTFKYVNMNSVITQEAMAAMRRLDLFEVDRIAPRFLPTYDLYQERARQDQEYLEDSGLA